MTEDITLWVALLADQLAAQWVGQLVEKSVRR